ncbi:type I restriction-modification enzyme S subunit [Planktothrix agardhii CCAP 1459/11A]|uniref:Type I restriction-modification enzyme S subunit n=1 Tax=Planktothrix agardhii CCAP 1459/11A TaxID=282420 RepID=A0A4P6A2A8_PLAAG|nr:restriction endonuclease subunit S [Planktothrix agardhii]GDZ95197.1 type I restriction-modification enzyme S subunit [Planktothrix agardhii CCAP 1459/11A]
MMDIEGWESKPLFELLDQIMDFRGRTPKKLDMEWGGGDIPALSANNVEMGEINFSKECYLASDALYRKWMTKGDTQKGDVVLTTEAPLGNVAVIPDEQRYILSQRVILLRANSAYLCSDYLSHYLMSEGFQNLMRQQSSGTTATGIQRAKLEPLLIKFPSSKIEQKQIAEVLSTIDRAIAQTEAIIAKQQRIKTGLMQDLLTKGIDENGNIRSEATHQFKDSAIGRIPVEWEMISMDKITTKIVDGIHHTPNYVQDGIPFIVVTDLTSSEGINFTPSRFITEKNHQEFYKRADPKAKDVLVTKDGTLGVARIVPDEAPDFSIFVSVAMLRPKNTKCISELIWSFFESGRFLAQLGSLSAGTGLAHIHLEHFRKFQINLMPIDEQKRIFEVLNHQQLLLQKQSQNLEKLKHQKTGLMQDLLTGKVRVTSLNKE